MTRILSSDILIADVITQMDGNPRLAALVKKHGLKPGGKRAIDEEQFHEFPAAVAGQPITLTPGGSSANMLTTLGKLFGNTLHIDFIGAAGEGLASRMIKSSLEEAGITLLPEALPSSPAAKTALSYVIMFPSGQRTIVTYPGNAKELLRPEMITNELVQSSDVVLMQGSLWIKMGDAYADRLFNLSVRYKKELWLALPTYSMKSGDHIARFKEVIAQATLVLGNEEELARVYDTTPENALNNLKDVLKSAKNTARRTGFITLEEKGAAVVTADDITIIPSQKAHGNIVNTLGAGDTAFAGFAAGHLKGFSPADCARIAMALAGEKLGVNGPRLSDPRAALKKVLPEIYQTFAS